MAVTTPTPPRYRKRDHAMANARASIDWFAGLSRHGRVAAERITKQPKTRTTARKTSSLVMGSVFIGLGVSLFVHANLGVPAYDVLLTALRDIGGITLGQASWLFNGFLLLIATALGRRPTANGILFSFMNGFWVDVWLSLINDPDNLAMRILFVPLGTVAIAGGVAMVIHAGLTGGAIELLMNAGEDRGRDPFKVRRAIEGTIVLAGVLLGGDLGPATVFFVLTMSPILKIGTQALEDHRSGRAARLRPVWD